MRESKVLIYYTDVTYPEYYCDTEKTTSVIEDFVVSAGNYIIDQAYAEGFDIEVDIEHRASNEIKEAESHGFRFSFYDVKEHVYSILITIKTSDITKRTDKFFDMYLNRLHYERSGFSIWLKSINYRETGLLHVKESICYHDFKHEAYIPLGDNIYSVVKCTKCSLTKKNIIES